MFSATLRALFGVTSGSTASSSSATTSSNTNSTSSGSSSGKRSAGTAQRRSRVHDVLRRRETGAVGRRAVVAALEPAVAPRIGNDAAHAFALTARLRGPLAVSAVTELEKRLTTSDTDFVDAMLVLGGVDALWRQLVVSRRKSTSVNVETAKMITVLRDLVMQKLEVAIALAQHDELVACLFACVKTGNNPDLFEAVCYLIEELLEQRVTIFDLRKVDNLYTILSELTVRELCYMCRIVSMLTFDFKAEHGSDPNDTVDYRALPYRPTAPRVVDMNISILVAAPDFLQKLVHTLSVNNLMLPPTSLLINDASALAAYHNELVKIIISSRDGVQPALLDDERRLVQQYHHAATHGHSTSSMSLCTMLLSSFMTEPMFVLCSLIKSRRRVDVTARLYRCGLMQKLSRLFDSIDWAAPKYPRDEHMARLHGPSCECNADATLKTQFCRLMHSLCKQLHVSPNTPVMNLAADGLIASTYSEETRRRVGAAGLLLCGNESALLPRMIEVYKATSDDCTHRVWLSNCVEMFLRGANAPEQALVHETGMLQTVLAEVLHDRFLPHGLLQSSLDLLGELIKFNRRMTLHMLLLLDEAKIRRLCELLETNMVDGNVFLRALILSVHMLERAHPTDDMVADHALVEYLHVRRPQLAIMLMTVVTVVCVAQENISCVNTALCMFLIAQSEGKLDAFVRAVYAADPNRDLPGNQSALGNFRELLAFWLAQYQRRRRDCFTLENATGFALAEWRAIVNALLAHELLQPRQRA